MRSSGALSFRVVPLIAELPDFYQTHDSNIQFTKSKIVYNSLIYNNLILNLASFEPALTKIVWISHYPKIENDNN